jgi:mannose-6-phosphate isomerase-like protein (cupin superfamily)
VVGIGLGVDRADEADRRPPSVTFEPLVTDLIDSTIENARFRQVLFTGRSSQLVVMCLRPGEEIGTEVHEVDQLLYVVEGEGRVVLEGRGQRIEPGTMACVPAGIQHNVINSPVAPMKLFTVYSPPEHAPGSVHATRDEAEASTAAGAAVLRHLSSSRPAS